MLKIFLNVRFSIFKIIKSGSNFYPLIKKMFLQKKISILVEKKNKRKIFFLFRKSEKFFKFEPK